MMRWVLLRGLTREARHWGEFPERLGAVLPGIEVYCPDLPGNGRLHHRASPLRVAEMTDAVRRALAAAGVTPPYHLLGLSLGAMVALDWAARQPGEISAGVLLNTSLRPVCPIHWRLRPYACAGLLQLLCGGSPLARERRILHLTSSAADERSAVLPAWAAYRTEQPVSARNALAQLIAAARFRLAVKPAVPLLVLAGAADRLVDPRCSAALAAHWGLPFALRPSAGHDLPLDDGPWVAARIRDWLAGRAGDSADHAPANASTCPSGSRL